MRCKAVKFIFLFFAFLVLTAFASVSEAKTIYVPDDYAKIQWAVNNATDGDTIIVRDGIYYENVDVNKQLTLKSENGSASTIVQAAHLNDHVFEVTANYVNISGFRITGSRGVWGWPGSGVPASGIGLYAAYYCNVSDNILSENECGIHLGGVYASPANYNTISNNILSSNGFGGICIDGGDGNIISNNSICGGQKGTEYGILLESSANKNLITNNMINSCELDGIYIEYSEDNILTGNVIDSNDEYGIYMGGTRNTTMRNNTLSGNKYNFGVVGAYWDSTCIHDIDISNKVDGKPIYYLVNEHNIQIPSDAGYVGIIGSSNITVKNLTLTSNMHGVLLVSSKDCKIENINASDNEYGIYLDESENNTIADSNISSNQYGVKLADSTNNIITNCIISDNHYDGILLEEADDNIVINNDISNSTWCGIGLESSDGNVIASNKIWENGCGISLSYRWHFSPQPSSANVIEKNVISDNDGPGISLHCAEGNIVRDNSISRNHKGIHLRTSSAVNNILTGNSITDGDYGIYLDGSDNNRIEDNIISNNSYGFYFEASYYYGVSEGNILLRNDINSNLKYGIYVASGENNLIYMNNFQDNANNVYVKEGQNIWNSTEKLSYTYCGRHNEGYLGNYWGEYSCTDKDKNGIWDVPYVIDANNRDNNPLVAPFENYFHADVWVQIAGRDTMRVGREGYYRIVYGNSGDIDAYANLLIITFPAGVEYDIDVPWEDIEGFDFSGVSKGIETESETIIPVWIPCITAGSTGDFIIKLTSTKDFEIKCRLCRIYPGNPIEDKITFSYFTLSEIMKVLEKELEGETFHDQFELDKRIHEILKEKYGDMLTEDERDIIAGYYHETRWKPKVIKKAGKVAKKAFIDALIGLLLLPSRILKAIYDLITTVWTIAEAGKGITIETGGAIDPNDKSSSVGFNDKHFVSTEEPIIYTIFYENLENATAPAWKVKITDKLDADLDWESFSFGDINVAGETIDIPEGSSEISLTTRISVEPWDGEPEAEEVDLEINASFNSTTGIAEWEFVGRNITTGEPTDFLVPNKNPPKGEGWVCFSVKPKMDLTTGTEIRNKATIVFDVNPPMDTPEVFNTIDSDPPESWVEPLPEKQDSWEFEVRWNGTDNGSGIKDYSIYVSIDDMPYEPWIMYTANTSATFVGEPGHTYTFYSIARDNVGNTEEGPDEPDAITAIPLKGCYLGAYLGCGYEDLSCESISEFNRKMGKQHAIFVRYVDIKDSYNHTHWEWVEEVKRNGAIPMFIYDPWDGLDAINMSDVEYFALKSKEFNKTVFIVFGHEMNLPFYPWGNDPANYTSKFKEVAEIFHRIAPNVEMCWVPNQNWGYPWGGIDYGDGYSEYYPEGIGTYGEYVDWVGLNFYEKDWDEDNLIPLDMFIANIRNGQDGIDFYETFVVGKNKPMLIAETGAFDPNKDPTPPGERNPLNETEQAEFKNEWIKQVYNVSTLKEEFPRLNAICYFHVNKTETIDTRSHSFYNIVADYRIPESPNVYKDLISDPYFIGAENQPPIASFTYSPENPVVNQTITFNTSSSYDSDGKITNYEWDFGDGNITNTTEEKIKHSYSEAGIYEVTLTVTDDEGATNSTTKIITVMPAQPSVSISTDKYEYTAGDVMLINITIKNPSERKSVKFLWCLDITDYDKHFTIINRSLLLPAFYDKTFTLRLKLPELKSSFNASWHVAIFNATTSELISENHADWKYLAEKAMKSEDVEGLEKSVREIEIPF